MTQPELEQQVARCLTQRGLTLSVAESCTGGLLSARITDVAGASKFYKGGACTYCNEIKQKILGVRAETLETYTAVSQQTAAEMAQGIARVYETDLGVGITGYAGPDGGEDGTPDCSGKEARRFARLYLRMDVRRRGRTRRMKRCV